MNTMGRDLQVVAEHMAYVNDWIGAAGPLPKDFEPSYRKLEFVQTDEMHETVIKDKKDNPRRGIRRKREATDPHPDLINNGMTVTVTNAKGEKLLLTSTDIGKERKDGGNHILLQAYASQTLLDKLDPQGRHQNCVFAHKEMTAYTTDSTIVPGRPGKDIEKIVTFESADDLRKKIIDAKNAATCQLLSPVATTRWEAHTVPSTRDPKWNRLWHHATIPI